MRGTFVLITILTLSITACAGSESGPTPTAEILSTIPAPTSSPAITTTSTPEATPTTETPEVIEQQSIAAELGVPGIELLTPVSGGGTRPVLEWVAVEGTDHYLIAVRTPEGKGYWAWRTSDTSVPVGGLPRLNEEAAGPSITEGMTWSVVALDSDGNILAASNLRPIAP